LDKLEWAEVKEEMTGQKGIGIDTADRVGLLVRQSGEPFEMLQKLRNNSMLSQSKEAGAAMDDMELLFRYLKAFDCLERFSFDLSLARGLDYYTGVIFEV